MSRTANIAGCIYPAIVVTIAMTAFAQEPPESAPTVQPVTTAGAIPDATSQSRVPAPDQSITPQTFSLTPFDTSVGKQPEQQFDWFGLRSTLARRGITFDLSTTQFYQGVASGGLAQQMRFGGRNDYFVNISGEDAGLWDGATVTLHGETRYGESENAFTGALMPVNLMLALPQQSGTTTALTGVKLTQVISPSVLIYGGKLNTLDDTKQPLTGASGLAGFQNTSFIFNPVYTRTVPYSTFGAGFAILDGDEHLFEATVYDTNDSPTVSGFQTFFNNGVTIFAQLNRPISVYDRPGHQGISGTYSNGTYTDLSPSAYLDPIQGLGIRATPVTGSWCAAYNFDQALYVSPDDSKRKWGVFGNLGIADNNPSPIRWFASGGISGSSPIKSRPSDTFGVGYFYLGVSDTLKELAPILLPLRNEQGAELYYNIAVTSWFQLTPDLQVISPFRERAETSLLVGLRAKIDF